MRLLRKEKLKSRKSIYICRLPPLAAKTALRSQSLIFPSNFQYHLGKLKEYPCVWSNNYCNRDYSLLTSQLLHFSESISPEDPIQKSDAMSFFLSNFEHSIPKPNQQLIPQCAALLCCFINVFVQFAQKCEHDFLTTCLSNQMLSLLIKQFQYRSVVVDRTLSNLLKMLGVIPGINSLILKHLRYALMESHSNSVINVVPIVSLFISLAQTEDTSYSTYKQLFLPLLRNTQFGEMSFTFYPVLAAFSKNDIVGLTIDYIFNRWPIQNSKKMSAFFDIVKCLISKEEGLKKVSRTGINRLLKQILIEISSFIPGNAKKAMELAMCPTILDLLREFSMIGQLDGQLSSAIHHWSEDVREMAIPYYNSDYR